MSDYKVGDVVYKFPDNMTPEQVAEVLQAQGVIPRPTDASKRLGLDAPAPAAPPTFEPAPSPEQLRLSLAEQAQKATAARYEPVGEIGKAAAEEQRRLEQVAARQVRSLPAGQAEVQAFDDRYLLPVFRPTRIRQVDPAAESAENLRKDLFTVAKQTRNIPKMLETASDADLNDLILSEGDERIIKQISQEQERRAQAKAQAARAPSTAEVQASRAPPPVGAEPARRIIDVKTQALRKPTAWEELLESTSRQQVLSEEGARQSAARIADAQRELDRREAAGEDIGAFEYAGPLFSGILSTAASKGAGTTETTLAASLRSGLGTLSALAAEGYFRGLGYEVDKNGLPKDPDDFGYAVAQARRDLGLPEVFEPMKVMPVGLVAGAVSRGLKNVSPEASDAVTNLVMAIPQLAVPLPGVATESTERRPGAYDPEGRRRVSGIEVPSPLEDPAGFVDAETRRLARNIASGRTFADEFYDSPATRKWYANVYGDEDAAFWAGSVGEIAIPAGPGTLARAATGATKLAAGTKAARAVASTVISSAETARAARDASTAARAASLVLDPAADVAALAVPGRASDARVVRQVARSVLRSKQLTLPVAEDAVKAIKPTSSTAEQILDDVGRWLDPNYRSPFTGSWARNGTTERTLQAVRDSDLSPQAKAFYAKLARNVPDDMVLITDNLAVPRALARDAIKIANEAKQGALLRPVNEVSAILRRIEPLAPGSSPAIAAAKKIVDKAASEGRILSAAEQATLDKIWAPIAKQLNADPRVMATGGRFPNRLAGLTEDEVFARAAPSAQAAGLTLDQAVNDIANKELLRRIPQRARLSRDLTAAQVYLRSTESRLFESAALRRARALLGRPQAETVASLQAKRALQAAARSALRGTGQELSALAKERGSVDEALDIMLSQKIPDNVPEEEVWLKSLEALYGNPEVAKGVYANAKAEMVPDIFRMPTVKSLKYVDGLYALAGKFPAGRNVTPELFGGAYNRFTDFALNKLMPDYQQALLKVIMDEGVKKTLGPAAKRADMVAAGVDVALDPRLPAAKGLEKAEDALKELTSTGIADATSITEIAPNTARVRVYDPILSNIEKELAGTAEAFVQFAESIAPRQRAGALQAAQSAWDWALMGIGRNFGTSLKYGYVLPNLPYLAMETVRPAVLSLVTSGLDVTSEAVKRQVLGRRLNGGGIYSASGRYYSPVELQRLAQESGLGYTLSETQRVKTLAYDIMQDAEKAAAEFGGSRAGKSWASLKYELNPLTKVWAQRFAESVEVSFRQAVFEVKLAEGASVSEAADAARKSALDYSEVPGPIRDFVGRYVADAAQYWQLTAEFAFLLKRAPEMARSFYKANMMKAQVEDPYGVHGDAALKSLFIKQAKDGGYYVPGLERAFQPIEGVLAAGQQVNNLVASVAKAAEDSDPFVQRFAEGGVEFVIDAARAALPMAVLVAENGGALPDYKPSSQTKPKDLTDEQRFWALAAWARWAGPDYWNAFNDVYKPDYVDPPAELAAYPGSKGLARRYWSRQPPGGTPFVTQIDAETGQTVHLVFEPSKAGELNMELLRKIPGVDLTERLGWAGAAYKDLQRPGPMTVTPQPAVPKVRELADVPKVLFPAAPTAAQGREKQAATLAQEAKLE